MLSQMEMMLQPLQQVNASQAETIKKLYNPVSKN